MSDDRKLPTLFGMRVYTSRFLAPPGQQPREVGHPDWRERLHRNLSRPSTGRWEALTYFVPPPPSAIMLSGNGPFVLHPEALVCLYNLGLEER